MQLIEFLVVFRKDFAGYFSRQLDAGMLEYAVEVPLGVQAGAKSGKDALFPVSGSHVERSFLDG